MKNLCKYPGKKLLILSVCVWALMLSCDRTRRMPGWDYFPDMFYSTAYETFTRNPNFRDNMTMRVPPAGTVPRGFIPFEYTLDSASRARAGTELLNPFLPTDSVLELGRQEYSFFCKVCHGPSGDGNGHLYTSGLYPMKPRDLTSMQVVQLKDGMIYHTITLGFATMAAYGSQIADKDRWRIIVYVRQLQENAGIKQSTGTSLPDSVTTAIPTSKK